jgi:hypothetical protein
MKIKCLFFLLFLGSNLIGQTNLVLNPSFETYTSCPTLSGDVNKAIGWDTCRGSADFYHECASFTIAQVPINFPGTQEAINGKAYAGFYTFDQSWSTYRELLIGTLTQSLNTNQKYFISFKVSRADRENIVGYSTNKIGVKFTKVKQVNVQINNNAHLYTDSLITDTVNWTKISGSFLADSTYKYIMIGNFFDDSNTTIFNHGNGVIAYYYIDEVCVSTDSLFTENYFTTGIIRNQIQDKIEITPNPANTSFSIEYSCTNGKILVYNYTGQLFYERSINSICDVITINSADWVSGIYFVRLNNFTKKVLIIH